LKRWAKILIVLVLVLTVAAAASIPLFVNANTFRPAIEKQLTNALGRSVKIGDLSMSLFSGSLVAKDLTIADDPSFNAAPFLTAQEFRIGVSLRLLLFSHQVNVRSFQFEAPQLTVIRAVNGTWNFSSIGPFAAHAHAASTISRGSTLNFSDLPVGRIIIENGRAVIASLPANGPPSVYDHVNLAARNFSFASQFPFELNANLPAGGTMHVIGHIGPVNRDDAATSPADAEISVNRLDPVAAGFLDPNAGLSLLANIELHSASDGQTLISNGTIHIRNLKLHKAARAAPKPLDLTYSGTHRLKENSGQIEDLTAKVGDAAIHMKGTYQPIALGVQDPLVNLKLAAQNLPIDELQSLMTAAAIRLPNGSVLKGGRLSMDLAITGPVKSLVITGPIAIDDTRLVGFDIGSKIHGVAALSGLKTGDTTDFEKMRMNVRMTNAGVEVDKIDAVIPAMGELSGSGRVSPANQLDFELIVKLASAKGFGKIGVGLFTKLNGSGGTSGNSAGVPMRVTGTPDDPYITANVGSIVHKKLKSITSMFGKKK
jgi:AsmA protein